MVLEILIENNRELLSKANPTSDIVASSNDRSGLDVSNNEYHMHDVLDIKLYHVENNQKKSYMDVEKKPVQVFKTGVALHRARKDPNKKYKQIGNDIQNFVTVHIDDQLYQKDKKTLHSVNASDDLVLHQNVSKLQEHINTTHHAPFIDKSIRFLKLDNKRIKRVSLDHQMKEFIKQSNDKVKLRSVGSVHTTSSFNALTPRTPRECVDWALEDAEYNKHKLESSILELEQNISPQNNNRKSMGAANNNNQQQLNDEDDPSNKLFTKESYHTSTTDYVGKLSVELNQLDETLYRSLLRRQMFYKAAPIQNVRRKSFMTKTTASSVTAAAVGAGLSRKDSKESLHSNSNKTSVSRQSYSRNNNNNNNNNVSSSITIQGLDSTVKLIKNNELSILLTRKQDFESNLQGITKPLRSSISVVDTDETRSIGANSISETRPYAKSVRSTSFMMNAAAVDTNAISLLQPPPRSQRKHSEIAQQLQQYLKDIHDPAYIKRQESLEYDPQIILTKPVKDTLPPVINTLPIESNVTKGSSSSKGVVGVNKSTTFITDFANESHNIAIQSYPPMRPEQDPPTSFPPTDNIQEMFLKQPATSSGLLPIPKNQPPPILPIATVVGISSTSSSIRPGHLSHRMLSFKSKTTTVNDIQIMITNDSDQHNNVNNNDDEDTDDAELSETASETTAKLISIDKLDPSTNTPVEAKEDHVIRHRQRSMQVILDLLNEQETNRNKIIQTIKTTSQNPATTTDNNTVNSASDVHTNKELLFSTSQEHVIPTAPVTRSTIPRVPRSTIYFVSPKDTVNKMMDVKVQEDVPSKPYNIAESKQAINKMKLRQRHANITTTHTTHAQANLITAEERVRLFQNSSVLDKDLLDKAKINPRLGLSYILTQRARTSIEKDIAVLKDVTHKMAEKSLESARKLTSTIIANIYHKDVLRKDAIHLFKEKQFYQHEIQQQRLQQINELDQKQVEFLDKKISITKPKQVLIDNHSYKDDEIKDSFTKSLQQNILPKKSTSKHVDINNNTNDNNNNNNPIFLTQTKPTSLYSKNNKNNVIKTLTLTRENLLKLQRSFQLNNNVIDTEQDDDDNDLRDLTLESDLKYVHSYDFYLRKQIEQNKISNIKTQQKRLISKKWFIYLLINIKSYVDNNKIKVNKVKSKKAKKNLNPVLNKIIKPIISKNITATTTNNNNANNDNNNNNITTTTTNNNNTEKDNTNKEVVTSKLPVSLLKLISVLKQLIIMNISLSKDLIWDLFDRIIIDNDDYQLNIVYLVVQKVCDQVKISVHELYQYFKSKQIDIPMKLMYKLRKLKKQKKNKMKINTNYKMKAKLKDALNSSISIITKQQLSHTNVITNQSKPNITPSSSSSPMPPPRTLSVINNNLETVYENNSDDESVVSVAPIIYRVPSNDWDTGDDTESDFGSVLRTRTIDSYETDTADGMSVDHQSSTSSLWIPSITTNSNNNNSNNKLTTSPIKNRKIDKTFEHISKNLKNFDEQAWLKS